MTTTKDVQPDFKDESPMNRKNSSKKRSRSEPTTPESTHPPNKRTRYDTLRPNKCTKISIQNHNNNLNHTYENKENKHNNTSSKSTTQNNTNSNTLLNRVPKKKNIINIQLQSNDTHGHKSQSNSSIAPINSTLSPPKSAAQISNNNSNIPKASNGKINRIKSQTDSDISAADRARRSGSRSSASSNSSSHSHSASPSIHSQSNSDRNSSRSPSMQRDKKRDKKHRKKKRLKDGKEKRNNGRDIHRDRDRDRDRVGHRRDSRQRHERDWRQPHTSSHLKGINYRMRSHSNALIVGGQHINFPKTNVLPSVLQRGNIHLSNVGIIGQNNMQSQQKFKTTLCSNYMSGECRFGSRCHFAHGSNELRGYGAGSEAEKIWRSKPCKEYIKGTCHWGAKCRFAHGNVNMHSGNNNKMRENNNMSTGNGSCSNCLKSLAVVEKYKNENKELRIQNERYKEEIESFKHQTSNSGNCSRRKSSK